MLQQLHAHNFWLTICERWPTWKDNKYILIKLIKPHRGYSSSIMQSRGDLIKVRDSLFCKTLPGTTLASNETSCSTASVEEGLSVSPALGTTSMQQIQMFYTYTDSIHSYTEISVTTALCETKHYIKEFSMINCIIIQPHEMIKITFSRCQISAIMFG